MVPHKVSSERRRQMIAEAAYFRAEKRGFRGGDPQADWREAEAEVDARLRRAQTDHLVERVEQGLAAAAKGVASFRRRLAKLSAEARMEGQRELDALASLRDALKPKLKELREQGDRATVRAREQAEKLSAELADLVHRLGAWKRH
jgi:chromosome segregation ATPase